MPTPPPPFPRCLPLTDADADARPRLSPCREAARRTRAIELAVRASAVVLARARQSPIRGRRIAEKTVPPPRIEGEGPAPSFSLRPNPRPRPAPICLRRRLLSLPAAKQRLLLADASTPPRRRLDATGHAAASTICPAVEAAGRAAAGHATPSTTPETQVVLAVERPAVLAVVRRGQRRTSLVSALTKGVRITEGCSVMAPCYRQCHNDAKVRSLCSVHLPLLLSTLHLIEQDLTAA